MSLLHSIAVAQIDVHVGDVGGNAARIRSARAKAQKLGAKLVVFPELSLSGYPPEDLILRPGFVAACMEEAAKLAVETANGPAIIIGSPWAQAGWVYNAALLLEGGKVAHIQPKRMLPNYGIFDEKRLFAPGEASRVFRFGGGTYGLMICEDMWYQNVSRDLGRNRPELIIAINASPFESGKLSHRHDVAAAAVAAAGGVPMLYVNMVGAQDDIVFDGGSFAVDAGGEILHQFPEFEECVAMAASAPAAAPLLHEQAVWKALKLALSDYVSKNKFPGVLLGISGGIDSALAATLAVDALGKERVLGVLLPSKYTSKESNEDALALASSLGIRTVDVPIEQTMQAYNATLAAAMQQAAPKQKGWQDNLLIGGNLQSRIRGASLMALSNATGFMLLGTSNKSEVATGYTTLYGDSCGGYAPLKDIYKTQVYALARWRSAESPVMPERSFTRPPTAELAPGQKDEDQLPPYADLDAILLRLIEGRQAVAEIVQAGFKQALVEKVANMVRTSEYKRRQMPPGAKVSPMLFGRDWRYPLTNGWKG